jgi:tRNA dimethylallyltransferase
MVVRTLSAFTMSQLSEQQIRHRPLVVIVGPTAVGKSRIAIEVAKRYETDILTADSRQVYRGMDIGTDKPQTEAWQGVSHRLIDLVNPDEPFNAGLFRRHALEAIEHLYRRHRLPLVVGGTGLYVHTLLRGLCDAPSANHALRARLESEAREEGADRFYARLVAVDPATASKLHPRDTSKIIRALEVYQLSGRSMSEFQRQHGFAERPFSALVIGLDRDRRHLYRRIEERIDLQLANGLLEETRRLLDEGYRREGSAMKGLGYRHVAEYLAGECDQAEMVRRFKRDTRRFSKRQMTWFKRDPEIVWIKIEESEAPDQTAARAIDRIGHFLNTLGRIS